MSMSNTTENDILLAMLVGTDPAWRDDVTHYIALHTADPGEAGYTAEQILRIIASHAAGSATGLEGANPVFVGIDGTTTRIDGGYSAGTRTINSLNGD